MEAIIAQALLILGALAIWSVLTSGARLNAEAEDKTIAVNIAQYLLEEKVKDLQDTEFADVSGTGEIGFGDTTTGTPYWTQNSSGSWIVAIPAGTYEISYPDGTNADPLRIMVTITWKSKLPRTSSIDLQTLVSRN